MIFITFTIPVAGKLVSSSLV